MGLGSRKRKRLTMEEKYIPTPKALVELYARYFSGASMRWPIWKDGKWMRTDGRERNAHSTFPEVKVDLETFGENKHKVEN